MLPRAISFGLTGKDSRPCDARLANSGPGTLRARRAQALDDSAGQPLRRLWRRQRFVAAAAYTPLPTAPVSTPDSSQSAEFEATTTMTMTTGSRYSPYPVQVVTQQAGEATVWLSRPNTTGSLQVRVTIDPPSPGVGVNVGRCRSDCHSLPTVRLKPP